MAITRVDDERSCRELADRLLDPARTRPVAVVSTRRGEPEPPVEVAALEREIGDLADVVVVVTGPLTFALGDALGDRATVYGGAARVYPVGTAWVETPRLSPLRFCMEPADAPRALRALIADVRRFVAPQPEARPLTQTPFADPAIADALAALATRVEGEQVDVAVPAPDTEAAPAETPAGGVGSDLRPASVIPPSLTDPLARIAAASAKPPEDRDHAPDALAPSPVATPGAALKTALATIDLLKAEVARARGEAARAAAVAAEQFREERSVLLAERAQAEAKLRDARQAPPPRRPQRATAVESEHWRPDAFVDPVDAVRDAIWRAWVDRIPSAQKARYSLPDYLVGSEFASSVAALDPATRAKALKCAVDVLSGLARDERLRDIHPLRSGDGASAAPIERHDGAMCFRAYVEENVPSARRLHYWRLLDGSIELSRVVVHDDTAP